MAGLKLPPPKMIDVAVPANLKLGLTETGPVVGTAGARSGRLDFAALAPFSGC